MTAIKALGSILGVLCWLGAGTVWAEPRPVVTLAADLWCPYNCEPGSEYPGFMVELARRALEPAGYRVDYVLVPWQRALRGVQNGRYSAAIGASRVEAPGFVFPEIEQARMRNAVWTLEGSDWSYRGLESLAGKRLAAMGGYSYGPAVDAFLSDPDNQSWIIRLYGNRPLERGVRLLKRGRVAALFEDENVLRYYRDNHQLAAPVRMAGRVEADLRHANVYIAFSPERAESPKLADLLASTVERLRANGELASILKAYGLSDWR